MTAAEAKDAASGSGRSRRRSAPSRVRRGDPKARRASRGARRRSRRQARAKPFKASGCGTATRPRPRIWATSRRTRSEAALAVAHFARVRRAALAVAPGRRTAISAPEPAPMTAAEAHAAAACGSTVAGARRERHGIQARERRSTHQRQAVQGGALVADAAHQEAPGLGRSRRRRRRRWLSRAFLGRRASRTARAASRAGPPPMTSAEAHAAAAAEGLTLLMLKCSIRGPSNGQTGFKYVSRHQLARKPFKASEASGTTGQVHDLGPSRRRRIARLRRRAFLRARCRQLATIGWSISHADLGICLSGGRGYWNIAAGALWLGLPRLSLGIPTGGRRERRRDLETVRGSRSSNLPQSPPRSRSPSNRRAATPRTSTSRRR